MSGLQCLCANRTEFGRNLAAAQAKTRNSPRAVPRGVMTADEAYRILNVTSKDSIETINKVFHCFILTVADPVIEL